MPGYKYPGRFGVPGAVRELIAPRNANGSRQPTRRLWWESHAGPRCPGRYGPWCLALSASAPACRRGQWHDACLSGRMAGARPILHVPTALVPTPARGLRLTGRLGQRWAGVVPERARCAAGIFSRRPPGRIRGAPLPLGECRPVVAQAACGLPVTRNVRRGALVDPGGRPWRSTLEVDREQSGNPSARDASACRSTARPVRADETRAATGNVRRVSARWPGPVVPGRVSHTGVVRGKRATRVHVHTGIARREWTTSVRTVHASAICPAGTIAHGLNPHW